MKLLLEWIAIKAAWFKLPRPKGVPRKMWKRVKKEREVKP